jgi:hypothetical protein
MDPELGVAMLSWTSICNSCWETAIFGVSMVIGLGDWKLLSWAWRFHTIADANQNWLGPQNPLGFTSYTVLPQHSLLDLSN